MLMMSHHPATYLMSPACHAEGQCQPAWVSEQSSLPAVCPADTPGCLMYWPQPPGCAAASSGPIYLCSTLDLQLVHSKARTESCL